MTRDDLAAIAAALGDLVRVIREADPADKAAIYTQLGPTLTYQPGRRVVEAAIKPSLNVRKGSVPEGAFEPFAHVLGTVFTTEFALDGGVR
jgi:hypothetical protein